MLQIEGINQKMLLAQLAARFHGFVPHSQNGGPY